jgi:hypothetical protein
MNTPQILLLCYSLIIGFIGLYLNISEIKKQIAYNNFADKRKCCCIPNFMDVASNIFFIIMGFLHSDILITIGMCLVAVGSMYYHWNPKMYTLFYDRLPMSFVFGYILYITFDSVILPIISISSVIFWIYTMNLIPYSMIQYAPILVYLQYDCGMRNVVLFYIGAKICEIYDRQIYELTSHIISGHSIKHILAALSIGYLNPTLC